MDINDYMKRVTWQRRSLSDYPVMTRKMMGVLLLLRDAKNEDRPWQILPNVHGRTLNALAQNDWIVRSDGLDGVRYRITHRGLRDMRIYELPVEPRRYGGICPRCKQHNRGHQPVCDACMSEIHPKSTSKKTGVDGDRHLCVRCHKNRVHVTQGGWVKSYCKQCLKWTQDRYNRRRHTRMLNRIYQGEYLPCPRCGQMRYYTRNRVYEYCYDCHRQLQTEYDRHRRHRSKKV